MIATVTSPIAGISLPPTPAVNQAARRPESLYGASRVGRDANTTEIKAACRSPASKTCSATARATCNRKASLHAAVRGGAPAAKQAARRRPESLYEVLRVGRDATATEIKAAYRNLAKVYHPDCFHGGGGGDGRDFVEIHEAYELLSDPEARASYDQKWRSGSHSAAVGRTAVVYGGRRWETDQCW